MSPLDMRNKGMAGGDEEETHAEMSKEARSIAGPAPKIIAEHKVTDKDTLSGIALKYYGSAAEKLWKYIYEVNKAVIGAKAEMLKPGMLLRIPEKPKE